jgi:hypothetical protein
VKFSFAENRLLLVRATVLIFFAIGMLLSFKVWHTDRLFPLCPAFNGMPQFSTDVSLFIAVLLVAFLLTGLVIRKQWYYIALFCFLLVLLLQDQLRWQPWVYLYVALLLPFALFKVPKRQIIAYMQVLLIGVYLWSGLYKFSGSFIELTFDNMLRTLLFIENAETRASLHFLGYGIPLIEVLIACGLVFVRTRKAAILMGMATHVVILIYLIINQQNSVVYPWNIAMIVLLIVLFYQTKNSVFFWKEFDLRLKILQGSGVLFFIVLPVLNPVGLWDNYLSFKLYSGNNGYFCVGLNQDQYRKVDRNLHGYFWRVQEPRGKYWLLLNKWALDELNVPFYPEMRTFKSVSKTFCEGEIPMEKLEFVKYPPDFGRENADIFYCSD